MTETKTFAYTSPRNFRYLFLIDDQISKELICKLIMTNYRYWGGRYNPIIKVENNEIAQAYIDIIQYLDPDYVFHAPGIDIAIIKTYPFLHPREFKILTDRVSNEIEGVESNNFLTEDFLRDYSFTRNLSLMYINDGIEFPGKQFYQLNFGVTPQYVGEDRFTKAFKIIHITTDNYTDINKVLHQEKLYFKSHLSELHANTTTIRAENEWAAKQVEFIIYDEGNPVDDLLYFWNRQLYQRPGNQVKQLIASKTEFELLILDSSFEGFLYEMLFGASVYVLSKSINEEQVNVLINKIQAQFKHVNFLPTQEKVFPYPLFQTIMIGGIHPIKSLLLGTKDYLKLSLPVVNDKPILSGRYVYDLELVTEHENAINKIKFPYCTEFYHLVFQQEGRINQNKNISLFLSDAYAGIDVKVPSMLEIIRLRLMIRNDGNEHVRLPISYPTRSNAGQRLSAFINLFENNWHVINNFTSDKFWLELFMGNSEFKSKVLVPEKQIPQVLDDTGTPEVEPGQIASPAEIQTIKPRHEFEASKILGNKGIFSYKDLQHERTLIYFNYREEVRNLFTREASGFIVEEDYLDDFIYRNIHDDFKTLLDNDLQYLVDCDALFMGMKVKCNECGSNGWYSLNELQNKMKCKGCLNEIIPKFDSPLYYKLNDVIINNLVEASSNARYKPFHGNYVVLRTLAWLRDDSRNCNDSFLFSPCLEFEVIENGKEPWTTDIDILAIQNGKFIIGEAKTSAKDFNPEVMKQLAWFGNQIRPDILLLAYESGTIDPSKLERLRAAVKYKNCQIVPHQVGRPWYQNGRIFGLPHSMNEEK